MSLSVPQLDDLVALLSESLRARAGDVIDDLVIADRARNAALLLSVTYEMRPLSEQAGGGCDSEDGAHCSHWPEESCCICEAEPKVPQ